MTGFVAADAVEPMEYNFAPYSKSRTAKGVIPEPSTQQINGFFEAARKAFSSAGMDGANRSKEDMIKALESQDSLDPMAGEQILFDAMVTLCQGHPAREDLEALPFRVRSQFTAWLMGQLNPEA